MKAFDNSQFERYKEEARECWGNTDAYREYTEKTVHYGKEKWDGAAAELDAIFGEFAACMKRKAAADSPEAHSLVKKLQEHITANYYTCTDEILKGLGQMYVCDERFKKNIDRHGEGTAAFASEAIAACCRRK